MESTDPRHLLTAIAEILEKLKIPYIVTGGMAVFVWGRPRFTADIDIVIALQWKEVEDLAAALRALGEAGYIDEEMIREAISRHGEFNFIDGGTGVKVDFWVTDDAALHIAQLARKIEKNILGKKVYFISPEDLIISKLRWHKYSMSSRHLEDLESILRISGNILDREYLRNTAEKVGVKKELEEAIKKASTSPREGTG